MVSGTGNGTTVACDPTILWQVSMRNCLHLGQDECELSHLSMQGTWKTWLHFGKSRTLSSLANSERHITHSVSKLGSEGLDDDGSILMTKFEHLKAHLMIEFNPNEQITAHNRTKSIMTTFASKFRLPRYRFVELWMLMEVVGELA
ncbi:hypothetical protein Lal_00023813 [Lupinus albus]|nr:hypothetical protein Lal_00023813 [Lupinus albus]